MSFKIYADFECNVKRVSDRNNNTSYTEKYQAHIPCSFAYKLFVLMINSINQFFFCVGKNAAYRFIEIILREKDYCQKMIKNILTRI